METGSIQERDQSERGARSTEANGRAIFVVGINHKTAPLELREQFVFRNSSLGEFSRSLLERCSLDECVVLSTCNRTELYAVGKSAASAPLLSALAETREASFEQLESHSYHHTGPAAVRHLCRVAAGLDSLVVGEGQIMAQVKEAHESAAAAHTSGAILSALFRGALTTGKRARSETEIVRGAVSVSHAAVELARTIFDELTGCRALVLGTGEMSEITIKLLQNAGLRSSIMISSRTPERAYALAKRCQGIGVEWDQFPEALAEADIVIVSTSAPHFIVRADTVRQAMKVRRRRHMFLIDISVPRNVEPSIGELPDVFLYNIDDLKDVVGRNLKDRNREAEKVEPIIAEEVERFQKWFQSLDVAPAVVGLRQHVEGIRQQEWKRFEGRLAHLSEKDRQVIEALTRQLVNKIIHQPTVQLKALGSSGAGYDRVEVVRELFGLPGGEAGSDEQGSEDVGSTRSDGDEPMALVLPGRDEGGVDR